MYLKQADIFWGINKDIVKKIMDITIQESFKKGDFLFSEGDHALHFFILLKGRVKLILGEAGPVVYIISHAGEAFGWSSLIDRDSYSASAMCIEPTKLLKIEKNQLQNIFDKDPANGLIFFKHLAGTIGNRLLESYKMVSAATQTKASPSFGTGQTIESATIE